MNNPLAPLVGKIIESISGNTEFLRFTTADGKSFTFTVEGGCCSYSYFHDIIGVEKLLAGGEVTEVGYADVPEVEDDDSYVDTQVYGFKIVSDHPEFGDVTTVFSFRNESNGYYGGWMRISAFEGDLPEVIEDVYEFNDLK